MPFWSAFLFVLFSSRFRVVFEFFSSCLRSYISESMRDKMLKEYQKLSLKGYQIKVIAKEKSRKIVSKFA